MSNTEIVLRRDIMSGCQGDCNCSTEYGRSFLTREEKVEMLREYKEALEKEAKGVSEKIKELEKAN